jgi:hypothetical protein
MRLAVLMSVGTFLSVVQVVNAQDWTEESRLIASEGSGNDRFGTSVAVSGDTALVGCPGDDDRGSWSGSVYVFGRVNGEWVQTAKLLAADGETNDQFGSAVAMLGNLALVGAPHESERGFWAGAVYVFEYQGGQWTQSAKLTASDAYSTDYFGSAIALQDDLAVIGAWGESDTAGAAYVLERQNGVWHEQQKLVADARNTNDIFGSAVTVSNGRIGIGAQGDDDRAGNAGAAFVFERAGSEWVQTAKLTASDGIANDGFGTAISASGDSLLVGAPGADPRGSGSGAGYVFRWVSGQWALDGKLVGSGGHADDQLGVAVSLEGDQALLAAWGDDESGFNAGAVLSYTRVGGSWGETSKLMAGDAGSRDQFGAAVARDGEAILIGAYLDDDNGVDSGSAYVFRGPSSCPADFNRDGGVNTQDVLAFLQAWANGLADADFNGDGSVNTQDVIAFLGAWVAGC